MRLFALICGFVAVAHGVDLAFFEGRYSVKTAQMGGDIKRHMLGR
jgi:hypothetical protein